MPKYKIQQSIRTNSKIEFTESGELKCSFNCNDVFFKQWGCNIEKGSFGDYWILESKVEANNWDEAFNKFFEKTEQPLSVINFISRCRIDTGNSMLIYKTDNNPKNHFFFINSKLQEATGLSFAEEEIKSTKKLLDEIQEFTAFGYLSEAINTRNHFARLMLLLAVAESFSDTENINKCPDCCKENPPVRPISKKKDMKKILGEELYEKMYKNPGIRHKLMHGSFSDFEKAKNYSEEILKKIIKYINSKWSTSINAEAKSIPRSMEVKKVMGVMLKTNNEDHIDLKRLMNSFSEIKEVENGLEINGYEVLPLELQKEY